MFLCCLMVLFMSSGFSPLISGRSSFLPFPHAVNSSLSPHSSSSCEPPLCFRDLNCLFMTCRSLHMLFFLPSINRVPSPLPHIIISLFFLYGLFPPPQLICFDRFQSLRPTVPIRYVVLSDVLRSMIFLHLED